MKRPLFICAAVQAVAIAFAVIYDLPKIYPLLLGIAICFVFVLIFKKSYYILFLAIFVAAFFDAGNLVDDLHEYEKLDGQSILLEGKIYKIEKKSNSRYVYLNDVNVSGDKMRLKVVAVLTDRKSASVDIRTGNKLRVNGDYNLFEKAANYGNFDERKYYLSEGVAGKIFADGTQVVNSNYNVIAHFLAKAGERLHDTYSNIPDENVRGIFEAITLGDKRNIDSEYKKIYQEAGIAHVLAISGLHISILGMTLFRLLRKILRSHISALISIAVLICFIIMSGMHVSGVRAVIMFVIYMISLHTGKSYDLMISMSVASILILINNPLAILNSGFQLSFGAILAIAVWGNYMERYFEIQNKTLKAFGAGVTVTMFTMPVIAGIFHQIPVYGILINLLIIPLMAPVLGSAVISGIAGFVSVKASTFIMGSGVYIIYLIETISTIFLNLPYAVLNTGTVGILKVLIYYLFLSCFLLYVIRSNENRNKLNCDKSGGNASLFKCCSSLSYFRKIKNLKCKRKIAAITVIVILFIILCIKPPHKGLGIYFFDVGQGDGILLRKDGEMNIMVDGGSGNIEDIWNRRLESTLKYKGITTIDHWVITHPDKDHIEGLLEALKDESASSISIKHILIPYIENNENETEMLRLASAKDIPVTFVTRDMSLKRGELEMRFLHPDKEFVSDNINSYSAVFVLEYEGFKALFTGDAGAEEEEVMIRNELIEDVDLLKVGHHGSIYSSSKSFIEISDPEIAIISCGKKNLYGHPHDEVLNRLITNGTRVITTAEHGEVDLEICSGKVSLSY